MLPSLSDDWIVHGVSSVAEVRWTRPDRSLAQIARWVPRRVDVTDSIWSEYETWRRSLITERTDTASFERSLRDGHRAARGPLPFFGTFWVDATGNVWLSEYRFSPRTPPTRFSILSHTGEWLGSLEAPGDFMPLQFGEDVVLGVQTNELDEEAVVVYGIEKGGD